MNNIRSTCYSDKKYDVISYDIIIYVSWLGLFLVKIFHFNFEFKIRYLSKPSKNLLLYCRFLYKHNLNKFFDNKGKGFQGQSI